MFSPENILGQLFDSGLRGCHRSGISIGTKTKLVTGKIDLGQTNNWPMQRPLAGELRCHVCTTSLLARNMDTDAEREYLRSLAASLKRTDAEQQ